LFKGEDPAGIRITTAEQGRLEIRDDSQEPVLQLSEGQTYQVRNEQRLLGGLSFEKSAVTGATSLEPFRARGKDERELTSWELFKNRDGSGSVDANTNSAALHLRLARSALVLILPFIAVPFGLNYGRNPSSAGIFIGVVMLLAIQKSLEFAQSLGAKGVIPPWMGIWMIVLFVALLAAWLFRASAVKMGQPPLTSFQYWVKDLQEGIAKLIKPKRLDEALKIESDHA